MITANKLLTTLAFKKFVSHNINNEHISKTDIRIPHFETTEYPRDIILKDFICYSISEYSRCHAYNANFGVAWFKNFEQYTTISEVYKLRNIYACKGTLFVYKNLEHKDFERFKSLVPCFVPTIVASINGKVSSECVSNHYAKTINEIRFKFIDYGVIDAMELRSV